MMKAALKNNVFRRFGLYFVLVALTGLAGCGGSGGGSSTTPTTTVKNADPTGYYEFTGSVVLTGAVKLTFTNMGAIVYNNQILMTNAGGGELYDIQITSINGNSFSGTATVFYIANTQNVTTATVTGTIITGSSITGTLTGSGYGDGTFSLTYNNQMGVLPATTSNWGGNVERVTTNYVLTTDGKGGISTNTTSPITNGNILGCTIDNGGTIQEIGTSKLYNVAVSMSNCSDTTYRGAYTGTAVVADAAASALDLAIVKTDNTHAISGTFSAQ